VGEVIRLYVLTVHCHDFVTKAPLLPSRNLGNNVEMLKRPYMDGGNPTIRNSHEVSHMASRQYTEYPHNQAEFRGLEAG
jgi:hypothetical protein